MLRVPKIFMNVISDTQSLLVEIISTIAVRAITCNSLNKDRKYFSETTSQSYYICKSSILLQEKVQLRNGRFSRFWRTRTYKFLITQIYPADRVQDRNYSDGLRVSFIMNRSQKIIFASSTYFCQVFVVLL